MSVCVYVTKEKTRVRSESLHARDGQGSQVGDGQHGIGLCIVGGQRVLIQDV